MTTISNETAAQRMRRQREKADHLEQEIRDLKDELRFTSCRKERERLQRSLASTEECLSRLCC